MKFSISPEVQRILLLLFASLLLSWAVSTLVPTVIMLLAYLSFSLVQLARINRWVALYPQNWEPPESNGAWGDLFNNLYRLLRKEHLTRNELAQIIQRNEDSMAALRDGIIFLDRRQLLSKWNEAAGELLGLRSDTDRRQALTNFVRHPRMIEYLAAADFSHPLTLPAPLDEQRMLEYSVTRFGAGEYLLLIRDMTRLYRLEQMRKDFVANVSHELKTPLTVLMGSLETLSDTVPAEQTSLHRILARMSGQSRRMELLINDLLLLARLENTDIIQRYEALELVPVLAELCRDGALIAPEKAQQIAVHVPASIGLLGDETELRSAFTNLLTNAVNYTQRGGKIDICWRDCGRSGCLEFRDNGPGIAEHHLPRLSERFYRPDASRVTATGGTGLGLAIVKHVMLRHGGRLEISSTLGQGSCFSCCFPSDRVVVLPEE